MIERDERLFPLFASVETLPKIGPKSTKALADRGVSRVIDLLLVLPRAGVDRTPIESVIGQDYPTIVTVNVTIVSHQPPQRRNGLYRVFVEDAKTRFQLVFFRSDPDYIRKQLPIGAKRLISGSAELYENQVQITHPDYILENPSALPAYEPIYPMIGGVSPKSLRHAIATGLTLLPDLADWARGGTLPSNDWPSWVEALRQAHQPNSAADIDLNATARLRLAFDELLAHQLSLHLARRDRKRAEGQSFDVKPDTLSPAIEQLPFRLTDGQSTAVRDILGDLAAPTRMNRLLQGDVGSGKTAVAYLAMVAVASSGAQSVLMAPTEVLARQHSAEISTWAAPIGLRVACLTGRSSVAEKRDIIARLSDGRIDLLIGTHAVFEAEVDFRRLGLVVIDEQHRFGVAQRKRLGDKGDAVDVLIMSATPIPRSLHLAQFGDMDVSLLTEKPAGRKHIETVLVPKDRTEDIISRLKVAMNEGHQAYWVCPLVADSAVSERMAAETRFAQLKGALGRERVGLVHGQMSGEAKEAALIAFSTKETRVLVATTVVEVGVNVPNATIIVIEGAEGFGLAQLHQLRGRVGRSDQASTCVLLYSPPLTQTAEARLRALRDTNDGFALAELDLQQRGAGDVLGVAQSGLPRFRTANLEVHGGLMARANDTARLILHENPDLTGPNGENLRTLLHLMDQERAMQFLEVG
ncbi:MAG: ATP-dependent DNA helicase RecG [Pseudomonadota bacterium]